MDSIIPSDRPAKSPTCEPATPAHGHPDLALPPDLQPGALAKLTAADRENMLSLFPEHADRILAASRTESDPDHPHTVV